MKWMFELYAREREGREEGARVRERSLFLCRTFLIPSKINERSLKLAGVRGQHKCERSLKDKNINKECKSEGITGMTKPSSPPPRTISLNFRLRFFIVLLLIFSK